MRGFIQYADDGSVAIRTLSALSARGRDATPVLRWFGEHMVNSSIPANFEAGGRPSRWAGSLWTPSGKKLMSSHGMAGLGGTINYQAGDKTLVVGSHSPYARQRQLGGTIEAKGRAALVVPLPHVPEGMRRPRRWGDRLFKMTSKKGDPDTRGVLATEEHGQIIPQFVLRRRVKQPARPFILFQDEDLTLIGHKLVGFVATGAVG